MDDGSYIVIKENRNLLFQTYLSLTTKSELIELLNLDLKINDVEVPMNKLVLYNYLSNSITSEFYFLKTSLKCLIYSFSAIYISRKLISNQFYFIDNNRYIMNLISKFSKKIVMSYVFINSVISIYGVSKFLYYFINRKFFILDEEIVILNTKY